MKANKIDIKIVEKAIFDVFQEKHKDDMAATFDGTPIEYNDSLWGVFVNDDLKAIMAVFAPAERTLIITDAYTAPEARKKGYFTLLAKRFMKAAELLGFKINANTFEETSYPILKSLGFTHQNTHKTIGLHYNVPNRKEANA
jgi:GNAT superfamily N-acetyltransferase